MEKRSVLLFAILALTVFALPGACADLINLVSPPNGGASESATVSLAWEYAPSKATLTKYGSGSTAKAFLKQVAYKVTVGWLTPDLVARVEDTGYQVAAADVSDLDKALTQSKVKNMPSPSRPRLGSPTSGGWRGTLRKTGRQ